MKDDNQHLLLAIKLGNKDAFTVLFRKYYKDLVLFGGIFIKDKECCEDIVQSVFLRLWENRASFEITTSLRSFLLQSVRNGCLDTIRHLQVVRDHENYSVWMEKMYNLETENYVLYTELSDKLHVAINALPIDCKTIFEMNKIEGLKYKEIALQLSITERTVELRIVKALKLLRENLSDYFVLLLFYLLNLH